jgi:hypothetical protein
MAEAEKRLQTPEPIEKGPAEVPSRVIKRAPSDVYSALDPLYRGSQNVNVPSEATYKNVHSAALAATIAQNAQALNLQPNVMGPGSLPERFKKMIQSLG